MAEAAQIDTPAACNNIMVDNPHPMQAPDRSAKRRTKGQPRTPALSARHISPDTPPTSDSMISIHTGISTRACCSFVIALPHKRKNPAQWPGSVWWCVPLLAVAPIEDGYFLQVDSGGSKPVLMPPPNKGAMQGECRVNAGKLITSAISSLGAVLPVPPVLSQVGQLQAPRLKALPHRPTFTYPSSCKDRKLKARVRAHGAYVRPLRSHMCVTCGKVGQ